MATQTTHKYLYNGIELQGELALNVFAAQYRTHDPQIGRWWQIDPKAEVFYELTGYNHNLNNPVRYDDPKGDCPPGVPCDIAKGISAAFSFSRKQSAENNVARGAQGVATETAYTGIKSEHVRSEYQSKVSSLDPTDSKGRTQAKVEARAKTPQVTKTMAENMRPMSGEGARTGGTANKTNVGVNSTAKNLGRVGKAAGALSVGFSVYNVATAEDKSRAVAEEGGALVGAVAGGETGAAAGAAFGLLFGGAGAVSGAIIGGIIGSATGAIMGAEVGGAVHDEVEKALE